MPRDSKSDRPSGVVDFPLPKDTRSVARAYGGDCRNLGLWLDRYALYEQRGIQWELSRQSKQPGDERLSFNRLEPLLGAYAERWRAALKSYDDRKLATKQFNVSPDWRLVIGLGAGHVMETSITLHRIYGFPFIPGSSLKGMTRAYVELAEKRSEADEQFRCIFGSQLEDREQSGEIIFFDAIPAKPPRMRLDVMNPHYSEYYQGGEVPPADWLSPIPVYFLTVERTPFLFGLAARNKRANGLVDVAAQWLTNGLKELGVGAKTAAGYGYFS
jgi:CRISPR-associated protein Cmr6